ncbi:MAG: MFS transporter [Streptosporangiales bacterium]|nr:MFS transporter [Streptosporangiales bacterium]
MSRQSTRPRLGADFGKLWAGGAVSNIGDGVTLAAGPLLVLTLTRDPALVAGAVFVQQLPWLLFSLLSGAYADRLDRRLLVVVVNLLRGAVVGGLAAAVWLEVASIPLVYGALFLLGVGETLADVAGTALLPSVVAPDCLTRANARLVATHMVGNQLAAPPFGAWLFTVAAALPFGVDAASFLVAAALVAAVRQRPDAAPAPASRGSLRSDIAEGVRWLWEHRALRMLAICLCLMNVTFMAAFAVWALYVRQRLGLGEIGFGLFLTAGAGGGVLGSAVVNRLNTRFGAAALLRAGLVVETATHLSLATVRVPWAAALTMVIFGMHAAVWGVIALTLRQRLVPAELLGRVNSAYMFLATGGAALGALPGGLIARTLGITAPFWIAFAGMAALTVVVWPRLTPAALAPRTLSRPGRTPTLNGAGQSPS